MRQMRSAYTLTELLVATAVGSIVMAMAFSSFSIINQKYQKYSDLSDLHRSATQVLNIITRDLRMAGYQDLDTVNGSIASDFAIYAENNSNNDRGSDAITIVYDIDAQNRIKIKYYLACKEAGECTEREGRYRLYKTKWSKIDGSWNPDADYEDQAVADYIDDLQFTYNMSDGGNVSDFGTNEVKNIRSIDVSVLVRTARKHKKNENYRHELEDNGQFNLEGGYIREVFSTTAYTRNLELGG